MYVEILGEGTPQHAIVACVHGDETCGWHAVNRLKQANIPLQAPIKFVLANERAFRLGYRFCESDLNRVSPGDPDGATYEERLAARLRAELEGLKVLDFHSTEARTTPLALVAGRTSESLRLARSTGIGPVVDMDYLGGGVTQDLDGVAVECGYYDDESAATMAYKILLNFLAAEGIIDRPFDEVDQDVYEVFGVAEGAGYTFVAENLERVEAGAVFARKNGEARRAETDFYPVLMSTHGYEDIIGFMARRVPSASTNAEGDRAATAPSANGNAPERSVEEG
jgi:predicted deacylase